MEVNEKKTVICTTGGYFTLEISLALSGKIELKPIFHSVEKATFVFGNLVGSLPKEDAICNHFLIWKIRVYKILSKIYIFLSLFPAFL